MTASKILIRSALIAALGGLLFGFETAVISGTTDWLQRVFDLNDAWLGVTVASALVGTIFGSMLVGKPADVIGRRGALFVLAVLYFVAAVGCGLAPGWWSFVAFRFVGGLAVGGASVVSPMYIAEISPATLRGRLVAVTQFNIVLGVLLAYLSNYLIGWMHLGDNEWRWMFGVMALPAAVFFCLLFRIPNSPRWLLAKARVAEARRVLDQCGTDTGDVEEEIRSIQASLDTEHHSLEEPFLCKAYLKPILLAVAIAAFNQLSGVNAIVYYTKSIFQRAGSTALAAMGQAVVIGLVNLVFTMAALAVIDHFGRRKLMLVGSIGYIASLAAAAYSFYANAGGLLLASLIVFTAAHAFGQGAVIWVFISEIFPTRVRARGQALGSFTHWTMATAITCAFPMIAARSGGLIFTFFAVCMVGQLLWVLLVMPETKGVSLEKIQELLGIE
jgi:sugar porter (SP) family MFS transporter